MKITIYTLGAGRSVGKSCIVAFFGGVGIMFDCGVQTWAKEKDKYPNFEFLLKDGDINDLIDAVVVTHFHLDHIAAIPYLTKVLGYRGSIYMSYPTRALMPLVLEDFHKNSSSRFDPVLKRYINNNSMEYQIEDIQSCLDQIIPVSIGQQLYINKEVYIQAYYAGHVLGGCMFYAKSTYTNQGILYTGDFNTAPERHLKAAQVECLQPDLIISESTYVATLRQSRIDRDMEFTNAVKRTIQNGGKVLIPVAAIGRTQELFLTISEFWRKENIKAPIYYAGAMIQRANIYYQLLNNWTTDRLRTHFNVKNPFEASDFLQWDDSLIDNPDPCVLFATPNQLSGGTSLRVFLNWAQHPQNLVCFTGVSQSYSLQSLLMKQGDEQGHIFVNKYNILVKCQRQFLKLSAHADANGILKVFQKVRPKNVMLVHGEQKQMEFFANYAQTRFQIPCYCPENGTALYLPSDQMVPVKMSSKLYNKLVYAQIKDLRQSMQRSSIQNKEDGMYISSLQPYMNQVIDAFLLYQNKQEKEKYPTPQDIAPFKGSQGEQVDANSFLSLSQLVDGQKICIVDRHELLDSLQPNLVELFFRIGDVQDCTE